MTATTPSANSRRGWSSIVVALVLVLVAGWWLVAPHTYMTVREVRASLAAAIPDGADASRVLAILDSLHAEHSDLVRDSLVTANFGKSWRQGMISAEIFGTFYFDSQRPLLTYKVEEISTGP